MSRCLILAFTLVSCFGCSPTPSHEAIASSEAEEGCEELKEKLDNLEMEIADVREALDQASAAVRDLHMESFALRAGPRLDIAIIEVESAVSKADSALSVAEVEF